MEITRLDTPPATPSGRAPRAGFPGVLAALLLAALPGAVTTACAGRDAGAARAAPDPESVLWGGGRCREATDCASGHCTAGLCMGWLAASTEESRAAVAPALRRAAEGAGLPAVTLALEGVLADGDSDDYVRGRAADAYRFLPPAEARRVLPGRLQDPAEPVRFFAARALAAAGDAAGRRALAAFRDHPSEAVRTLARAALEPVPPPVDQGVNSR